MSAVSPEADMLIVGLNVRLVPDRMRKCGYCAARERAIAFVSYRTWRRRLSVHGRQPVHLNTTRVSDPQSAFELAGILAARISNAEKSASIPATTLLNA
jgi:hypothetical protein